MNKPASASTLRHQLRTIDRALQPLITRRDELEAAMASADHRERETAAIALAELVPQLHGLEEEWLDVATALEEMG